MPRSLSGTKRGRKGLGVVEPLIKALQQGAGLALHDPKEFNSDPTDCVCCNAAGERQQLVDIPALQCRIDVRLAGIGLGHRRDAQVPQLAVGRSLAQRRRMLGRERLEADRGDSRRQGVGVNMTRQHS